MCNRDLLFGLWPVPHRMGAGGERSVIVTLLGRVVGAPKVAAACLEIKRSTLQKKIKKLGISWPDLCSPGGGCAPWVAFGRWHFPSLPKTVSTRLDAQVTILSALRNCQHKFPFLGTAVALERVGKNTTLRCGPKERMHHMCSRSGLFLGSFISLLMLAGCGSKGQKPLPDAEVHILKLSSLVMGYHQTHKKKWPVSTEAFTKWARQLKPDQLRNYRIDDLEEALVSPRDHHPYQIAPPPKSTGLKPGMPPSLILYEKVGVNGGHMFLGGMGASGEMDDELLKMQVPNLE
jgi:hypothetical protein